MIISEFTGISIFHFGPLTFANPDDNSTVTFSGISIFLLPILDIIIYQTLQITSPPTPKRFATLFDKTPFEVDRMDIPNPSRTLGS